MEDLVKMKFNKCKLFNLFADEGFVRKVLIHALGVYILLTVFINVFPQWKGIF